MTDSFLSSFIAINYNTSYTIKSHLSIDQLVPKILDRYPVEYIVMTEETNILRTPSLVPVNDADNKTTFSVTFSDIKVRVYNGTIGDNPACSQGVPIR